MSPALVNELLADYRSSVSFGGPVAVPPLASGAVAFALKGSVEQIARRQASVRSPSLSNSQNLLLAWQVTEMVKAPDDLAKSKVTREDHVVPGERDDQEAMGRPRPNAWDGGETRFHLLIR